MACDDKERQELERLKQEAESLAKAEETILNTSTEYQTESEKIDLENSIKDKELKLGRLQYGALMPEGFLSEYAVREPKLGYVEHAGAKKAQMGDERYSADVAQRILEGQIKEVGETIDPETGEPIPTVKYRGMIEKQSDAKLETEYGILRKKYSPEEILQDVFKMNYPQEGGVSRISEIEYAVPAQQISYAISAQEELDKLLKESKTLTPKERESLSNFLTDTSAALLGAKGLLAQGLSISKAEFKDSQKKAEKIFEDFLNKEVREEGITNDEKANKLRDDIAKAQDELRKLGYEKETHENNLEHEYVMQAVEEDRIKEQEKSIAETEKEIDQLNAKLPEKEIDLNEIKDEYARDIIKRWREEIEKLRTAPVDKATIEYNEETDRLVAEGVRAVTQKSKIDKELASGKSNLLQGGDISETDQIKSEIGVSKAELNLANHIARGEELTRTRAIEARIARNEDSIKKGTNLINKVKEENRYQVKREIEWIEGLKRENEKLKNLLETTEDEARLQEANEFASSPILIAARAHLKEIKKLESALKNRIERLKTKENLEEETLKQVEKLTEAVKEKEDRLAALNKEILDYKENDPKYKSLIEEIKKLRKESSSLSGKIRRIKDKDSDTLSQKTKDSLLASAVAREELLKAKVAELEAKLGPLKKQKEALQAAYARRNLPIKQSVAALKKLDAQLSSQIKRLTGSTQALMDRRKELGEQLKITLKELPPEAQKQIQPFLETLKKIDALGDKGNTIGQSQTIRAMVIGQALRDLSLITDMRVLDFLQGIGYINLLSGLTTQSVNVLSNVSSIILREIPMVAKMLLPTAGGRRARNKAKVMKQAAKLGHQSLLDIATGGVGALDLKSYQAPKGALAFMFADKSRLTKPQQYLRSVLDVYTLGGKYMLGMLSAVDKIGRNAGSASRLYEMAELIADNNKFENDNELLSTASNILYNSTETFEAATKQAKAELAIFKSGMKEKEYRSMVAQRAFEIIEMKLTNPLEKYETGLAQKARDHLHLIGEEYTFQKPLDGWIGAIAYGAQKFTNDIAVMNTRYGAIKPLKFTLPIIHTVANVTQNAYEYAFPFGVFKAAMQNNYKFGQGQVSKETVMDFLTNPENTKNHLHKIFPFYEQRVQFEKAMVGAIVAGIVMTVIDAASDDDEPWVQPFGSMSYIGGDRKKELLQRGVKPYSFVFNLGSLGVTSFNFAETPLVAVLAPIADYFESKKYNKKHDEEGAFASASRALASPLFALSQTGFLRGVGDAIGSFTGEGGAGKFNENAPLAITDSFFNTAKAMFSPGGGVGRSIDLLNPNKTVNDKYDGWKAKILGNTPVFDDIVGVRPALNKYGEEIKIHYLKDNSPEEWVKAFNRVVMTVLSNDRFIAFPYKTSPEDEFLVKHGLTISYFPKYNNIKHTLLGATKGEKAKLEKIVRERAESGEFTPWDVNMMGRISHDAITSDEYYELVKLAGPKIKSAVQYVMRMDKATNQERQAVLDELITKAKAEAKAELFGLNRYKAFSEHKAVKRAMKKIKKQNERREMLGLDEEEQDAEE